MCGILALVPDLAQLIFGNGADHGLWADIFFFHATIDKLSPETVNAVAGYVFLIALLVWLIVVSLALNAQTDRECKESIIY